MATNYYLKQTGFFLTHWDLAWVYPEEFYSLTEHTKWGVEFLSFCMKYVFLGLFPTNLSQLSKGGVLCLNANS